MSNKIQRRVNFTVVGNALIRDERLTTVDKMVFVALVSFSSGAEREDIFPGREAIACRASTSVATVKRSLQHLEETGYLQVKRRKRPDGGNASNLYLITEAEFMGGAHCEPTPAHSEPSPPAHSDPLPRPLSSLTKTHKDLPMHSPWPPNRQGHTGTFISYFLDRYHAKTGKELLNPGALGSWYVQARKAGWKDEVIKNATDHFFDWAERTSFSITAWRRAFEGLAQHAEKKGNGNVARALFGL